MPRASMRERACAQVAIAMTKLLPQAGVTAAAIWKPQGRSATAAKEAPQEDILTAAKKTPRAGIAWPVGKTPQARVTRAATAARKVSRARIAAERNS